MIKRLWFVPVLLLGACAPSTSGPVGEAIPRAKGYLPFVAVPEGQTRTFEVPIYDEQSAVLLGRQISINGQPVQTQIAALVKPGNYTVTVQEGGVVYMPTSKLVDVKQAYPDVQNTPSQQFYKFCFLPKPGDKCTSNILAGGVVLYFNSLEESPIFQVYGDPGVRGFTEIQGNGLLLSTRINDFKTFLSQLP